ncbi:MAG: response regulator [Thermodesulfobacteriota bacterium]
MSPKKPKTILIADSDDFFRARLSEALIQRRHTVKVANEGEGVIKLIEDSINELDFLVLDHNLPPADSFQILNEINESGYRDKFPILILCKEELSDTEIEELKSSGADGFMLKGFSYEQISYQIDQILYRPIHLRIHPRISVSIPATFAYGSGSEDSRILNMSEQGLFWYSRIKHKTGTEITVSFSLQGQDREMEMKGIVMRYRRTGELNNRFTEVGLQLTNIKEEDRADLKKFIDLQIHNIYP